MSETDTRPAVPAKAGDWVELRCGVIVGPLSDNDCNTYPLGLGTTKTLGRICSWCNDGKAYTSEEQDEADIVAIVQRPDLPPQIDDVNHPAHYTSHPSGVHCIAITRHMMFDLGNAIKYIWRAGLKSDDPVKDLRKAIWYLQDEIKRLESANGPH